MSLRTRVRSDVIQLRATLRMLPVVPRFRARARWSASRLLRENARRFGGSAAIAYQEEQQSWREVDDWVNRWAHFFSRRGIGPGDVVALMMDNRPTYLHALTGLNRIGAVGACINTHATGSTLVHAINIARARMVLAGAEHAAAVKDVESSLNLESPRQGVCVHADGDQRNGSECINDEVEQAPSTHPAVVDPRGEDPMAYLYTSGTTGLPKAAMIKNSRFIMAAFAFGHLLHEATHDDVIYVALPLYHGNAQWGGWGASLATGATIALRRKFSASAFWQDARKFGATRFTYIGELCRYLLNQPETGDERNHRIRIAVGNGLRRDVWETFQKRFGVPLIREFYGATEGNAPMFNLEGRPGMVGRLSIGQVLLECDPSTGDPVRNAKGRCIEIEDPEKTGLLVGKISTLTKFDGYVDERATEKKILRDVFRRGDAYFNSGDLLTLHEDKWVSFSDRVGDTYRWKGENVSTNEVAEVLNHARGVIESNVYGVLVPHAEGRAGMAIIRTDGDFDLSEFTRYVLDKLPSYQRPYFLRLSNQMRVTSTMKLQKGDYRAEGFDPYRVDDPLYFLDGNVYVPLDRELYDRIQSGQKSP